MAASGSRGGRKSQSQSRTRRSSGVPVEPHFSRVMTPETLELGMLCIPPTFVLKYGNDLSSPVRLEVFNGDSTLVKLKRRDGKLWFGKGWRAFVLKHNIEEAFTVFFWHEGSSKFHVVILDDTSKEIEYSSQSDLPVVVKAEKRVNPQESEVSVISIGCSTDEESGDESYELPHPSKRLTRESRREEARGKRSRVDIGSSGKQELGADEPHQKRPNPSPSGTKRRGVTRNSTKRLVAGVPRWGRCWHPDRVSRIANKFVTRHPSYLFQLRKTYMKSGGLSICREFMVKYGLLQEENVLILKGAGSNDRWEWWPVKLLMYKEERGKLCAGWIKFVKDNSLRIGDVCIFELAETNSFRVHIFRSPPEQMPSSSDTI